jgi:hypothetical protein
LFLLIFCVQAAKIDHYAKVDRRYDSDSDLHAELFKKNRPPNNIRYCLMARMVLERHVRTLDGATQMDSKNAQRLFETDARRSRLTLFKDGVTPSSLLAEKGGFVSSFR